MIGIGIKLDDDKATEVSTGYRNLNHYAQTAVEMYHYVKEAVLSEAESIFNADELTLMSELDLPLTCDKTVLSAICDIKDIPVEKVNQLTESQVLVLVDLIVQGMLVRSEDEVISEADIS